MNHNIKFKDKVGADENKKLNGGLKGRVIFGTGKHLVEYINPLGQKAVRTEFDKILYEGDNIVPIGGYQFVFDKLFNIGLDNETTLRVGDLNDEAPQMKIGVNRGEYDSIKYNAECVYNGDPSMFPPHVGINISALNFVFGFMVGDGGSREDNITAIAPNYKSRSLYNAIPFRMSNDGTVIDERKYFGKYTTSGNSPVTSYYVKKFDAPDPHIVHVWASGNNDDIVDDTVFSSTSSLAIESYVEINISINSDDVRGYFTSTGTTPRINEIGLVSGWYNEKLNDYEALRLFTHFTRPAIVLDGGDSVEAVYRLYAR